MLVRPSLLLSLVGALASHCAAAVPRGWRWTSRYPFRELTAVASSEQKDRWPAAKGSPDCNELFRWLEPAP